jgi:hypothetical protein
VLNPWLVQLYLILVYAISLVRFDHILEHNPIRFRGVRLVFAERGGYSAGVAPFLDSRWGML